jgi:PAS domain S-box-containing protein
MMHPQLARLINGLSPELRDQASGCATIWEAVSQKFEEYEKNIYLLEHASSVAEQDYQEVYRNFKETTEKLNRLVKDRTEENDQLIQFPLFNPNPVISTDLKGAIIFQNDAGKKLNEVLYQNKHYLITDFFTTIISGLKDTGNFEIKSNDHVYLIFFKKIEHNNRINFYFSDITELWDLQQKSYDNFYRLNNFLEATDSVHYIIYARQKEKNFFTSRWPLLFGFNPGKTDDPIEEKRKTIVEESLKEYDEAIMQMELSGHAKLKYQVINKVTNKRMWLEEEVKKRYDPFISDEVIIGKITDITGAEMYREFIAESESRFKNITDALPVMTWVSDYNNRVTYSNNRVKEFFGKGLEEIRGIKEFEQYIHPDYRDKATKEWHDKITNLEQINVEFQVVGADGKYHYVQEIAIPRFLNNGEFVGYIGSFFDLTKEYEYSKQLQADKKQFELIALNSSDITVITDWQGRISYISPGVKRLLDYEAEELVGQNIFSYFCEECRVTLSPLVSPEMFLTSETQTFSFRLMKRTGELLWVEAVMTPFSQTDGEDKSQTVLMHIRDIHEQQMAFDALKSSEERYRTLFQNMNLGILQVDSQENITFVNEAMENITGYPSSEIIGKKTPDVLLKTEKQKVNLHRILDERKGGKASVYELNITRKNGKSATIVVSGVPLLDNAGRFIGAIGINWDVTELRAIENRLLEEKIDKEKSIIEARLQTEEEQRAQIGRDLHDGVGQMLAYITLYLNVIKSNESYGIKEINEIEKTVKNTLEQVRTLSRTLAPPAIRDLGLRDSVIELIDSYGILTKPVFQLSVYAQKNEFRIPLEVKIVLYRILQELLNNTFKYAKADTISIRLSFVKDNLCLDFADDGRGFDFEKQKKGVGLESMKSRVLFYKGTIDIKTAPGKGTKVSIKIPSKEQKILLAEENTPSKEEVL